MKVKYRVQTVISILLQFLIYLRGLTAHDDYSFPADRALDGSRLPDHRKCEPITVPFCQDVGYNETMMPNLYGHKSQTEIANQIYEYTPALRVNCSPDIQSFLCSYYVPICTDPGPLPPCRSLCLSVKNGCEKLLLQFSHVWPPHLECNNFLDDTLNRSVLCVRKDRTSNVIPPSNHHNRDISMFPELSNFGSTKVLKNDLLYNNIVSKDYPYMCPEFLKLSKGFEDVLRVNNTVLNNCALPCDIFFKGSERDFSHVWIGTWSGICAVSCLFTVLTFSVNTSRFRYPERPIIFLSFCYLIISVIYIFGSVSNNKISCREPIAGKTVSTVIQGTKNEFCTIMFIGLYFFSMASSLWWVILSLTWFLAAGLKWSHEAIEANSQYFHLAAWALPTIKTITILAMGKVEGDNLTGVCNVGIWNMETMRNFVLIPLSVYLLIGIIFLIFGFVSLFRIRNAMKHDGTKTDKLEKLMLRIGIFSVLYTVPALTVIFCLIYELINFNHWMITWYSHICQSPDALIRCVPVGPQKKPLFFVFMLKYLSSLIVGITSIVWIWSNKTLSTWKKLFLKMKSKKGQAFV